MRDTHPVGNLVFILSVVLLIANDWCFKPLFHNGLTGKLSDFAGLLAFPFLLSVLFAGHAKTIHVLTGLLFVCWKSEYAQPVIDFVNGCAIPIRRTVDLTDAVALSSIPLSYCLLKNKPDFNLTPIVGRIIMLTSGAAFMATTMLPHDNRKFVNIGKAYEFRFSKRELVSRLNMVQMKEVREINKLSGQVDFDGETNVFHYHGRTDTLALLLDYEKVKNQDTIVFKTSLAEIAISGDEANSRLELLTVYKLVPSYKNKDYRDRAIKQFERRIIKKIEKFR